jgi:TonB family protein
VQFGARIDVRTSAGTPAGAAGVTPYHEIVHSTASGEFSLENVPDGTYDITISAPGFAKQEHQGVLFESAKAKPMDIQLQLGTVHEQVQVQAQGFASPAPGASRINPQRIRVGGNVQAANLIHKTTPMYPVDAKADGVEGTVLMTAVIGKDGSILSLTQVNKLVDPRLARTAIEAVKEWMYKPTLLNGEPVEVLTQIEVNFTLTH